MNSWKPNNAMLTRLSACLMFAFSCSAQTPLTLAQAVEAALKNFPSIRVSQEQMNAAAAGIDLARTAYLPRVDAVAQENAATRNNGPQTSVTWGTTTFSLAAAGPGSAVTSTTIPLPADRFTAVSLLASGLNGGAANQVFTVTYSDGTSANFTQSLSDWYTPKKYAGESVVATMAYRVHATGTTQAGPVYLYGYVFTLDAAKVVSSITLPANANVVVVGIDLTPVAGGLPAAAPTMSPAPGTYGAAQTVSLSDATPGAVIYYTEDGTTPTTASTLYAAPLSISTSTTLKAIAVTTGYSASAIASWSER